jgi:antitoxin component YwqK of YwqJK toxin-antitoxin module
MKYLFFILITGYSLSVFSQIKMKELSSMKIHSEEVGISMSQTSARYQDDQYKYFETGSKEPFTGLLYAKWENGNYQSIQEFKNGIGEGTWINYYKNGQLKEVGTYVNNRVEGPIKKYHHNGQVSAIGTYKEWRIRVGQWKFYNEEGKYMQSIDYGKKGDLTDVEDFYKRGEIPLSQYNKNKKRIEE